GVGKRGIGKIDIRSGVCYVSISSRAAEYVVTETNDTEYRGHKLKTSII
ncbi:MAG: DbpA RNA binding domain-containing protein, partial [Bacteroidales bacterium]|nr:DbpA RNA binding domain-containing protein [Bacteroidales bacterium]